MARAIKRTHSVRFDDDDMHELGTMADAEGRSVSDLIRESVRTFLEMKSKRKIGIELTPDALNSLQWMIQRGYINNVEHAVSSAMESYLASKLIEIEERQLRRQRLDAWAREEKRVQW